jgi:predicted DNA-binding transcriptional regulator YafY
MKRVMGFVAEKKVTGGYEMVFAITNSSYFARWLLMAGTGIRIIQSDHLKAVLVELVRNLQRAYL